MNAERRAITIGQLQHRARMLQQFKADRADCLLNARAFRQCQEAWGARGEPEIALVAAGIATQFEIDARARKLCPFGGAVVECDCEDLPADQRCFPPLQCPATQATE